MKNINMHKSVNICHPPPTSPPPPPRTPMHIPHIDVRVQTHTPHINLLKVDRRQLEMLSVGDGEKASTKQMKADKL